MLLAELFMVILALPATAVSLYLLILTLLSRAERADPPESSRQVRFDIIVPAHNEALLIQATVKNLLALDWPKDHYRIIVVADNCDDATATLAREAGAQVLERYDENKRGKGYALDYAFQYSLTEQWADAVVVVDADTEVSPNMLEAYASRIENGAHALQGLYGVLNPNDSWRTRLMTIAYAALHQLRWRAREHLKLSCGIRGNGWCVTHSLLNQVPYKAFSLTEDLEYSIDLALANYRVVYADEVQIRGLLVSSETAATSQRQRWEGGRWSLIRSRLLPLLRASMRPNGKVCLDLALEILVPPLSYVFINIVFFMITAGIAKIIAPSMWPWLLLSALCALSLILYVMRGWQLSGVGMRGLLDLARVPSFVLWKLLVMLRKRGPEWVRTDREMS